MSATRWQELPATKFQRDLQVWLPGPRSSPLGTSQSFGAGLYLVCSHLALLSSAPDVLLSPPFGIFPHIQSPIWPKHRLSACLQHHLLSDRFILELLQAIDRRERLRRLALETIDLSKDPYFMRNHLGQVRCRQHTVQTPDFDETCMAVLREATKKCMRESESFFQLMVSEPSILHSKFTFEETSSPAPFMIDIISMLQGQSAQVVNRPLPGRSYPVHGHINHGRLLNAEISKQTQQAHGTVAVC